MNNKITGMVDSILEWWENHKYDTEKNGEDEYNLFDEKPTFVKIAEQINEETVVDIKIIKIADEIEPFIEVSTESDFQYSFRLHEQCEVLTNHGSHIKGELSYIGDDCLKIQTADIGELTIMYSSIIKMSEVV